MAQETASTNISPQKKADIPTPALLVDLDAFEANLQSMAAHGKRTGRGLRPHAKTHKCPEIAKRQVALGALGICAATVPEAEGLVAAGITNVLLTSPIVQISKIARMAKLAKRDPSVMLSVGAAREVNLLAEAAEAADATINVLVDLDVGDRRTGILPGEPALELAQLIAKHRRLRLRGVQAYAGHASHVVGFEARQKVSYEAMSKAAATRQLFIKAGLDAPILTGASTGTYNIDSEIEGVTELQVGSYVFMDVDYRRIGGRGSNDLYTDFQPSLSVLATVVSATHPDRVTIDAGTKGLDTTTPHAPQAKGRQGLSYTRGGDEFGILTVGADGQRPDLGDRIEFIVPHCDPTANLYDRIYAVRGDKVEGIWPLIARREFS